MTAEQTQMVNMAIGRIFRIASRPEQSGDVAEYTRCRNLILDLIELPEDRSPCIIRDRWKGAQGQW